MLKKCVNTIIFTPLIMLDLIISFYLFHYPLSIINIVENSEFPI